MADLPGGHGQDQGEFAQEQREPIDQFVLMIFALLGLALVIAVVLGSSTLALSVIERNREVGCGDRRQLAASCAGSTLESVPSPCWALLGVALDRFRRRADVRRA